MTPRPRSWLVATNTPDPAAVEAGWWAALFRAVERVAPEVLEDLCRRATGADAPAEAVAAEWARAWHLEHDRARAAGALMVKGWRGGLPTRPPLTWYGFVGVPLVYGFGTGEQPAPPASLTLAFEPSFETVAEARARLTGEVDAWLARTADEAGARRLTVNPKVLERFALWQCMGWDAARLADRYGIRGTRTFATGPATGTRKPGPWRYGAIHSELKRTAAALGLALRRGRPGKRPAAR